MTKLSTHAFWLCPASFRDTVSRTKRIVVSSSPRASMSKENPLKKVASAINAFMGRSKKEQPIDDYFPCTASTIAGKVIGPDGKWYSEAHATLIKRASRCRL